MASWYDDDGFCSSLPVDCRADKWINHLFNSRCSTCHYLWKIIKLSFRLHYRLIADKKRIKDFPKIAFKQLISSAKLR